MKIVGGGLAGLAAAATLGSAGFEVDLHEARPYLGGRAASFPLNPLDPDSERIDNCQHVLLRCFTNLLDLYRRLGVEDKIRFFDRFYFVRPGGDVDLLKRGILPAPLHLAGSLARFGGLSAAEKWAVVRALLAIRRRAGRDDLDDVSMGDWLAGRGMSSRALERFWRPILVSALNEEPQRASARWGFQVFAEGMMASRTSYEMGVPAVPLSELYSAALGDRLGPNVRVHLRSPVERIDPNDDAADYYLAAVPFERVNDLAPGLDVPLEKFEHSPITGIHLWFDRPVTALPHAILLERTIQWLFRKSETYFQLVVSASRPLLPLSREEVVRMACEELGEFFPEAGRARLVRSHVIKEARATFSARPGMQHSRPGAGTKYPNVFLAGDWTDTGWPPTMEGAVRSGYRAAEEIVRAEGQEKVFLVS